jgi:hypothetical protein
MGMNNESPHPLRWVRLTIIKGTIFIVGFDAGPELFPFITDVALLLSILRVMVVPVIVYGEQFVVILANSVDLDVGDRDLHDFFDLVFEAFFASALPEHFLSDSNNSIR